MPIKFRCQHCRQFLGISRSKAGAVVDCPTCGRTIRIPDLDGRVRPVPQPAMNLRDSRLARALDELASMDVLSDSRRSEGSASPGPHISTSGLVTQPEPVELPPLPAPEAIEMAPLAPLPARDADEFGSDRPRAWASTVAGGVEWQRLLAEAGADASITDEGDSSDEPVQSPAAAGSAGAGSVPVAVSSAATFAPPGAAAHDGGWSDILRSTLPLLIISLGLAALVFATGFWIGRVTAIPVRSGSSGANGADRDPAAPGALDAPSGCSGRVTWRTDSGERRADAGAILVALPVSARVETRLPAIDLREAVSSGAAPSTAAGTALAALRSLGGDAASADDDGRFRLSLPVAGQYYLLALSNSVPRDDEPLDAGLESALGRFFDRPAQLVGQVRFVFDEVHHTGQSTLPWDVVFDAAP